MRTEDILHVLLCIMYMAEHKTICDWRQHRLLAGAVRLQLLLAEELCPSPLFDVPRDSFDVPRDTMFK